MIDVHCHLEQKDYNLDREEVIQSCRKELKAIVNSCNSLSDFRIGIDMRNAHKDFIFLAFGLHPSYIKELSEKEIEESIDYIGKHKEYIAAIGEIGLDYYWIKEPESQAAQQKLFIRMIHFAEELKLPLVVHCRDAFDDTFRILQNEGCRRVMLHHFDSHQQNHIQKVIDNGWSVSIGPNIKSSKTPRRIARDLPLSSIMLETDSPWFGFGRRNTPVSIKLVAEQIAEIKKASFKEIWHETARNALAFFNLSVKI